MTLFRDEAVVFGGAAVGGIRISHMSELARPVTLSLTASKASRKPYVVQPLVVATAPVKKAASAEEKRAKAQATLDTILADIAIAEDINACAAKHADMVARIAAVIPDAPAIVAAAVVGGWKKD
jgi:hypothetical protein